MYVNRDSENSISIVLSEEELFDKYEILVEDLFNEEKRPEISKKIIEIVSSILVQFNIPKNKGLKLEISLSKNNDVIIKSTFTEEFNENNLNGIKSFVSNEMKEKRKEYLDKFLNDLNLNKEQKKEIEETFEKKSLIQNEHIFEFDDLDTCFNSIKYIKGSNLKESILYKYKDKYYLYLNFNEKLNLEYFTIEFCLKTKPILFKIALLEHGEKIIKEDAYSIINKLI